MSELYAICAVLAHVRWPLNNIKLAPISTTWRECRMLKALRYASRQMARAQECYQCSLQSLLVRHLLKARGCPHQGLREWLRQVHQHNPCLTVSAPPRPRWATHKVAQVLISSRPCIRLRTPRWASRRILLNLTQARILRVLNRTVSCPVRQQDLSILGSLVVLVWADHSHLTCPSHVPQ